MINYTISWEKKKIHVGKDSCILVNQLVGCNDISGIESCIKKIDMWEVDAERPDIITDVSLRNDGEKKIWEYAVETGIYIVGTVPIYSCNVDERIEKKALLEVIEKQLQSGVKIITIHITPQMDIIELAKKRIVPITSRGGGIIIKDLLSSKGIYNIYVQSIDEIISLCKKYNSVISIGTAFRPANIIDALDDAQRLELEKQQYWAKYISERGGNVLIEMPGHMPPKKIELLNQLLKENEYPIMPLGPVVTDIGVGMDHITASIGLTIMGLKNNVQIISAMTSEEHTGKIPTKESTWEAVKTARLVAHIIDMSRFDDYTKDYEFAIKRKTSCVIGKENYGCERCGENCPLRIKLSGV